MAARKRPGLKKLKGTIAVVDSTGMKIKDSDWGNSEIISDLLFECIEALENLGTYAVMEDDTGYKTCMDYILDHLADHSPKGNRKSVMVRIKPDSYEGNNADLRMKMHDRSELPYSVLSYGGLSYDKAVDKYEKEKTIGESFEDFIYRTFGMDMPISTAISEFYINNPMTHPENEHCSIYYEDYSDNSIKKDSVNCITKIIEMDNVISGYSLGDTSMSLYATPPYLNIINGGARCGAFNLFSDGVNKYAKTSCVEALMKNDITRVYNIGSRKINDNTFGYNIDKYDLSIDCTDTITGTGTIPCVQKLVQTEEPSKYKHYVELFGYSGDHANQALMDVLSKKYKFKPVTPDDAEESTAIDYMVNHGMNLWSVLQTDVGSDAFDKAECLSPDKTTRVSCLSKLLVNLTKDDVYYTSDMDMRELILMSLNNSMKLRRQIIESSCYDGGESIPCLSILIELSAKTHGMSRILYGITEETPLTDFMCSEKINEERRTINCLDKLISVSNQDLMEIVLNSGTLLDRKDCTDFDGTPITCIDKLFQRHEMWVHNYFRARELSRLSFYYNKLPNSPGGIKANDDSNMLKLLTLKYNLDQDPGFRMISGEYDIGSLKSHQPSKMFEGFKPVLDSQLTDYRVTYPDGVTNPPVSPNREEVQYVQGLVRSITSDKLSKETQIAPKIYKMVDVYSNIITGNEDYDRVGASSLTNPLRRTPITLNIFECKDSKSDKTISCLQKQIDMVKYASEKFNLYGIADNVMGLKDLFKPDMCITSKGDKVTCMEYAFSTLTPHLSELSYVALIARKDFSKVANVEIDTPGGKRTIAEVACKKATMRTVSDYLNSSRTMHDVTNGHPTFDGSAMTIIDKCKCADRKDPLERRICMDSQCFSTFIQDENADSWTGGYFGGKGTTEDGVKYAMYPQIYHDSRDYYGVAGVYDVTYKPSAYRITDSERFNYGEAVRETLFPAIRRMKGMKIPRIGDKKNVKIEEINLIDPSGDQDDFQIEVVFTELDASTEYDVKGWVEHYPAAQIFLKGGLLNREDLRNKVIRYKNENDTVEKILTRGVGKNISEAKLKLIVSNRPADFMRASTCQDWRSCMNLEDGCYNAMLPYVAGMGGYIAYLASDEFSPSWYARTLLLPVMRRKMGDPKKNIGDDPNNNIRINDVYGLSMYKPLLKDTIKAVLRDRGYNAQGTYKTYEDSDEFIASSSNANKIRDDIWMNSRKEAYRNCLQKLSNGESFKLPKTEIRVEKESDCEYLTKTLSKGGARIDDIYQAGLLDKVTYDRFTVVNYWDHEYLDSSGAKNETTDSDLQIIREKVNVEYAKPITIPADLPNGVLKGAA